MDAIKAEFRKLLTVRSTYFISGIAVVLTIFFAFYVEGFKAAPADMLDPHLTANNVLVIVNNLSIFCAIVAILLATHEYRYNTIMYTLTASSSRTKTLLAKLVAVSVYSLIFVAIIGLLAAVMSRLGAQVHGLTPVAQTAGYGDLIWRCLFYGWSTGVAALVLALIIRIQVGAIASLFLIPTAEQLLGILLKHNSIYLPFMAQSAILTAPFPGRGVITHSTAALVFTGYVVGGLIVAWVLFQKRDAN